MNGDPPRGRAARWSWSLGSLAGVDVRVHVTFLVLLAWIALSNLFEGRGVVAALLGLGAVVTVFSVVVLHELGHAMAARHYGIRTRDITLLPIGGVARLERMPTEPMQELLVALAGPAVNLVLAAVATVALLVMRAPWSPAAIGVGGGSLATRFLWLNLSLALFNLLPAFPMDGGRVFRALLSMKLDRARATEIAARIGHWMALGFGLVGLFGSPILVFIALFVWIGATEEANAVTVHAALDSLSVGDAMVTEFIALPARGPIERAASRAVRSAQRVFPILDAERFVGFATIDDLVRAVLEGRGDALVSAIARAPATSAIVSEPVERALERMRVGGDDIVPVVDDDRLVGLLSPRTVAMIAAAHHARRRAPDAPPGSEFAPHPNLRPL